MSGKLLLFMSLLALVSVGHSYHKEREKPHHSHAHSSYPYSQPHHHEKFHHSQSAHGQQYGGHHQHHGHSHSFHKYDHKRPDHHLSSHHDHGNWEVNHHTHHIKQRDVNHCQANEYHHHYHDHSHPHRHHGEHNVPWQAVAPPVVFQVYEPRGLEVSIVKYFPEMVSFGIQLFVNRHPDELCDICQNVTTSTYGKFIIKNEQVVVKKGDTLYYNLLIGNGDEIYQYRLQRFIISDSVISKCNCDYVTEEIPEIDIRVEDNQASSESVNRVAKAMAADDIVNTLTHTENKTKSIKDTLLRGARQAGLAPRTIVLKGEIEKLEAMIQSMKNNCVSDTVSKALLLKGRLLNNDAIAEVARYLDKRPSASMELSELKEHIHLIMPAFGEDHAAIIEMNTYLDKQAMLYYARKHKLDRLVDYDCI